VVSWYDERNTTGNNLERYARVSLENSNDHQVILTFATAVTVANATATPDPNKPGATGSVSNFSVNGAQVTVNLTGVSNAQRLTITLSNVSDGINTNNAFMFRAGFLLGDVSANGLVNATDTSQTQAQSGKPVTGNLGTGNYRTDVNANGLINSTDTSIVQSKSGTGLP
jgi:hypothetical protein